MDVFGTTLPLLDQSWLKFRRAKEHLYALHAMMQVFWDGKPNAVVHEYDAKESKNLFRFKTFRDIPSESWGLILGDAVHNLRSALDYLAWRLAGSDLADIRTQFPICLTPDKFKDAAWRLKLIHADALAEIGKLQPYNGPNPKRAALWLLQELDARDKHKLITMVQSVTSSSGYSVNAPIPAVVPYNAIGKIEPDTVLLEYSGPNQPDVDVEIDLVTAVLFERGLLSNTEDFEVLPCLFEVFAAVEKILFQFDKYLRLHPDWVKSP